MSRVSYGKRLDLTIGSGFFLVVRSPLFVAAENNGCGVVTDTMDTFDFELLLYICE